MSWIADNWFTLIFGALMAALVLRGPLMARYYRIESISVHELAKRMRSASPPLVIDVRTPEEYAQMRIAHTKLFPLRELTPRLQELRSQAGEREIAVICRSGNRSLSGTILLRREGFPKVLNVEGGLISWQGQGYPVIS